MELLKRSIDQELEELMTGLAAIAIEGPKGVGKTESAKRLSKTTKNLDSPAVQASSKADIELLLTGEPPILIDEWQLIPEVWNAVRRAVDQNPSPGQFLLTGSATPTKPPTHSGAGRIATIRMRPLSLYERKIEQTTISLSNLLTGKQQPIAGETKVRVKDYVKEISSSGLPGIRPLSGKALRTQLRSYIHRIVDRDVVEQGLKLRHPEKLKRWLRAYAAASSTTASFETIRSASGDNNLTKTTTSTYREILGQLWILDPVPAWIPSYNHIKELTQASKHQLADPAIALQLLGLSEEALLENHSSNQTVRDGLLLGQLFESLVTLSVRVLAQNQESQVKHLRTKGGLHEVDLIVERPDQRVLAIEIKLNSSINDDDVRHLHWLKGKIGSELLDAAVINTGPYAYRRQDGIAVIPASLLGP